MFNSRKQNETYKEWEQRVLGDEAGLYDWAVKTLDFKAREIEEATGMLLSDARIKAKGDNIGLARIEMNGILKFQGEHTGSLKDRNNERTEKHINWLR